MRGSSPRMTVFRNALISHNPFHQIRMVDPFSPALAGADVEDGEEPLPERFLGLLEHGAGDQRLLVATGGAFKGLARRQIMPMIGVAGPARASLRAISGGPGSRGTGPRAKAIEKAWQGARKIGFDHARSSFHGHKYSYFVP